MKEKSAFCFRIAIVRGFHWEPSDVWKVLPDAFGLAFVSSVNLLITSVWWSIFAADTGA